MLVPMPQAVRHALGVPTLGGSVSALFYRALSAGERRRLVRAVQSIHHALDEIEDSVVTVEWVQQPVSAVGATLVNQVLVVVADAHPQSGWAMAGAWRTSLVDAVEKSMALQHRERRLAAVELAEQFRLTRAGAEPRRFQSSHDRAVKLAASVMNQKHLEMIGPVDGRIPIVAVALSSVSAKTRGQLASCVVVHRVENTFLRKSNASGTA